jgi:hypothetical protein
MTRHHRRAHAIAWTLLGPLVLVALIAALLARPAAPAATSPPTPESSR